MPLSRIIKEGNLHRLQEIFHNRDNNGIPLVNVNQGTYASALHLITFTKHQPELKRLMVQTILDLRDNANNIIPDLNIFHPNAGTVLTAAIATNDLVLIQQILDVRSQDGNLAVDLRGRVNPGHFWFPLTRALFLNRIEVVQFLIDARNADGSPFYSLVEIQHALNGAHCNGATNVIVNESTTWLIEHLRERGVNADLFPNGNQFIGNNRLPPEVIIEPVQRAEIRNNAFFANGQNTHATEVTISIENSIKKLLNRYNFEQNAISEILLECENYIRTSHISQKEYALGCINRIKRINLTREPLGITLSCLLALVWKASEDKTANTSGEENLLNDRDIADRKKTLIDNLIAAQTTYGPNNPACFVGTFNKIIESLDQIHPDVTILTGRDMILPVATERACSLVIEKLLEKNLIEVKSILITWDDSDSEEAKTKATQFRESIVPIINTALESEFKHLLTRQERQDITSQFEYLPRPSIISKEFEQLIKTIEDIVFDDKEDYEKAYISHLKHLTTEIYTVNDITFEELYEKLLNKYEIFRKIELIKQIRFQYKGNTEYHLAAIANINTAIKNYYFLLQFDNFETFDTVVLQQLITHIDGIRKAVATHLKQHSKLRFFPFLKPKSQLIDLIDSALKKFNSDEEVSLTSNRNQI